MVFLLDSSHLKYLELKQPFFLRSDFPLRSLMPVFSGSLSTDTTLHVACQGLH